MRRDSYVRRLFEPPACWARHPFAPGQRDPPTLQATRQALAAISPNSVVSEDGPRNGPQSAHRSTCRPNHRRIKAYGASRCSAVHACLFPLCCVQDAGSSVRGLDGLDGLVPCGVKCKASHLIGGNLSFGQDVCGRSPPVSLIGRRLSFFLEFPLSFLESKVCLVASSRTALPHLNAGTDAPDGLLVMHLPNSIC